MSETQKTVLSIDPGRIKCGLAVVRGSDVHSNTLHHEVIDLDNLETTIKLLNNKYNIDVVVIGDGTGSQNISKIVKELKIAKIEFVDEKNTSILARSRYFIENPPRGWRRLLPISLQTPPELFDDYVAVILAERYLNTLKTN